MHGLVEGDPQVVAKVRAARPPAPASTRRRAAHAREECVEEIAEAREAISERRARPTHVAETGLPRNVVDLPALGIGEDLVRLVDLLEPFGGGGFGADVRMPLLRQLAKGALDVRVGGAALDAEDLVVGTLGGHLVKKDTRRVAGAVSRATATRRRSPATRSR